MSYLKRHGTRRAPQSAPIPARCANSAGGFAWAVDDWTRLRRFLILGSEGGSYYAGEWKLTRENAEAVERCLAADGAARRGRDRRDQRGRPGAEERPGASSRSRWRRRRRRGDAQARRSRRCRGCAARARTCSSSRRSSRASAAGAARCAARSAAGTRRRSPDALAYQAVKYRQRDGVTHRDLLRLAHPAARVGAGNPTLELPTSTARLFEWIVPRRRRPTACRGSSRASRSPRRRTTPARGGGARPRVRPAARGGPSRAPDLAPRSGRRCSRTCR